MMCDFIIYLHCLAVFTVEDQCTKRLILFLVPFFMRFVPSWALSRGEREIDDADDDDDDVEEDDRSKERTREMCVSQYR